jgi:hypothetical protein
LDEKALKMFVDVNALVHLLLMLSRLDAAWDGGECVIRGLDD